MANGAVRNEGEEQVIVLPREFHLSVDEVVVRREGSSLVLEPATSEPKQTGKASTEAFQRMLAVLGTVDDDFMKERDQGTQPERELFD
ncbi:MAG: hypothetical protein O3A00_19505 [Planctomycetota bacterium]|nr:hypothetical protein [Planctomycetota bacterium]